MSELNRSSAVNDGKSGELSTGIYVARVISHLDPTFMGSLEVTLLKDQANDPGDDSQIFIVRYAPPFFGYTPFEFMGKNDGTNDTLDGFNDTQKSYGMWFVPPDVGVNVLVLFVDGDPGQGYWFACVPGRYINNMVPAIAGSLQNALDSDDKERYGKTKQPLPVAEINKRINGEVGEIDPEKINKVVHPIADRFLEQGLLEDDVRGVASSTPRRELPGMVFGISTPGPVDRRSGAKKAVIGKNDSLSDPVPVSRLGGTQLVMDDGDDRYHREKSAAEGPVKYIDLLEEPSPSKSQATVPKDEYFRVRTRTGHQILLHNSEDLIYIGNARGTTWVELTSNGKIDIYAEDSISIHTENDLNIRADRDINIEAGRNINMKSIAGRMRQEVGTDWEVLVGENGRINLGKDYEHVIAGSTKITTTGNLDIKTDGDQNLQASGNANLKVGGRYKETATRIDMNGPIAAPATAAKPFEALSLHKNVSTRFSEGWEKRYFSEPIESIMKRIPMHEPWALHENQAPDQLTPEQTDRDA